MTDLLAFTITISATTVAWYAAIVATISVAVGGYAVWRDRARLKVLATPNMRLIEAVGAFSTDEDLIFVEAANVGRRPICLGIVWFESADVKPPGGLLVQSKWAPSSKIAEGERATMKCRQGDIDLSRLTGVAVRDATGRVWRGKIKRGD